MKPIENAAALKFFKSVFDSEKEALESEISRLLDSNFETNAENYDNKEIIGKLKVRLTLVTEYERSDEAHFLIKSDNERFICPRCLVHNSSETLLTLDVILGSGNDGEWRCRSCGLRYSPLEFNSIPTPSVPLQ